MSDHESSIQRGSLYGHPFIEHRLHDADGHLVGRVWLIQDLIPIERIRAANAEIGGGLAGDAWQLYRNEHECKDALDPGQVRGQCAEILDDLAGMVSGVSALTGFAQLRHDPLGGGVHRIPPGGHLDLHVDFNLSPDGWIRRLNLLTFVSAWQPGDGGELLIGPKDATEAVLIEPTQGLTVLFETGDDTWHGHPVPTSPAFERRSLAAYYFTPPPRSGPPEPRSTVWLEPDAKLREVGVEMRAAFGGVSHGAVRHGTVRDAR